jgi:hypothetical protein
MITMTETAGYSGMVTTDTPVGYTSPEGYTGVVYSQTASGYTGSAPVTGNPPSSSATVPASSYDAVVAPAESSTQGDQSSAPDLFEAGAQGDYNNTIVPVQDESDSEGEALSKTEVRREVVLFTQAASRSELPTQVLRDVLNSDASFAEVPDGEVSRWNWLTNTLSLR